ncbi:MAG: glycosyltransferase family 39 protein [Candidatus Woesebacteria bacterium]|nr:MAG: glycosyltransferase family 39 protein [Candidatus Woesebacteria bacterium]
MKRIYVILLGLLGVHLLILSKLQFTAWPEMLSFPYLFGNGYIPYRDFVFPYPPFLVLILSFVYKLFGYKVVILKIFTWGLILLSDIFIYKVTEILTKKNIFALFAVAFFVFVQPFLEGNMLWFDTFLVLPVLLSIYFLIKTESPNKFFWSGLFLAIAAFSKQTAFVYILAASVFVLTTTKNRLKNIIYLLTPSLIFGLIFLSYLFITKSFADFLNWNVIFPFKYWGSYPSYVQFGLGKVDAFVIVGMLISFAELFKRQKLIFLMSLGSLVAVYPRFSYYHLAVGVSLWAISFAILLSRYYKRRIIWFGVIGVLAMFVWFKMNIVLAWDWGKGDRFFESSDLKIVQNIDSNFNPDERIYLANIHSGIYVYADRLPTVPWYDNYGWYWEIPGQQEKVVNLWNNNPPAGIYWKDEQPGAWYLPGVYRPKIVYKWIQENYIKKEEIENGVWLWKRK